MDIRIVPLYPQCFQDMIEVTDDEVVRKYTAWYMEPGFPPQYEVGSWYQRAERENRSRERFTRLIILVETGKCIGAIGCGPRDDPRFNARWEIGYVVHAAYRRKGIAEKALRYFIDEFRKFCLDLDEVTLTAEICSTNPASINLAKKVGFDYYEVDPKIKRLFRWKKNLRDGTSFEDTFEMYTMSMKSA